MNHKKQPASTNINQHQPNNHSNNEDDNHNNNNNNNSSNNNHNNNNASSSSVVVGLVVVLFVALVLVLAVVAVVAVFALAVLVVVLWLLFFCCCRCCCGCGPVVELEMQTSYLLLRIKQWAEQLGATQIDACDEDAQLLTSIQALERSSLLQRCQLRSEVCPLLPSCRKHSHKCTF